MSGSNRDNEEEEEEFFDAVEQSPQQPQQKKRKKGLGVRVEGAEFDNMYNQAEQRDKTASEQEKVGAAANLTEDQLAQRMALKEAQSREDQQLAEDSRTKQKTPKIKSNTSSIYPDLSREFSQQIDGLWLDQQGGIEETQSGQTTQQLVPDKPTDEDNPDLQRRLDNLRGLNDHELPRFSSISRSPSIDSGVGEHLDEMPSSNVHRQPQFRDSSTRRLGSEHLEESGYSRSQNTNLEIVHDMEQVQVFNTDGSFLSQAIQDRFHGESQDSLEDIVTKQISTKNGRKELHDAVADLLEKSLKTGEHQKIEPQKSSDTVSVYQTDNGNLKQEEGRDGKFNFTPGDDFTGVLKVKRKGTNGKLLEDSSDIIEYKDGKPIAVIPGPHGESRVAGFGAIAKEAGIDVSSTRAQDLGVDVAASVTDSHTAHGLVSPPRTPLRSHSGSRSAVGQRR